LCTPDSTQTTMTISNNQNQPNHKNTPEFRGFGQPKPKAKTPKVKPLVTTPFNKGVPIYETGIYGKDDRQEVKHLTDEKLLKSAECVVMIVTVLPSEDVTQLPSGRFWINNSRGIFKGAPEQFELKSDTAGRIDLDDGTTLIVCKFGECNRLAPSERFYEQYVPALGSGTGFVVAPNLIATAHHCVYSRLNENAPWQVDIQYKRVIFGFRMRNEIPASAIHDWEIFRITQVLAGTPNQGDWVDWALVQLDRLISNQRIAPIRYKGKIPDRQSIYMIGHPAGLPLKFTDSARVQENTSDVVFATNLDAYAGNSGSPVFNSQSHIVEGLLTSGPDDFDSNGRSIQFPESEGYETCTRVTPLARALMQHTWSGFKPIPGFMGAENSDGDIAVVQLTPDGRPALIAAFIQKSPGQNRIYYQVGYGLDGLGNSPRWSEHLSIPGRFSAPLQGLGVAVADLNHNGRPDLVVFYIVKNAKGNQGYYRIGRDLDAAGNVTGGWTRPQAMPGRLGVSTQGAGIAIADLSGTKQLDLISLYVDAPQGENQGFYRVARNLNPDGIALGGWSEAVRVPGWFGQQTQGSGVAVTQMPGNNRPDLIVFHIDNPQGANGNRAYYRIGRSLDAAGNVTGGWSEVRQLPGEWGFENQGGGITVAHLGRNLGERSHPHPHLITFNIFNPPGGNYGRYRVGWLLP
jgi:V8-like Glu-specific endopeptidase